MNIVRTLLGITMAAALTLVSASELVDINTASAENLASAITGVGVKKAEAIVTYREVNGPFQSVDELVKVRGIGPTLLEVSRERLTVSPTDEQQ